MNRESLYTMPSPVCRLEITNVRSIDRSVEIQIHPGMVFRFILAPAMLLFIALVSPVRAGSYREISIPPTQVYKTMIAAAGRGELGKVAASLKVLSPISEHIGKKFNVDAEHPILDAVEKGEPGKVLEAVYMFIAWDINDLLREAVEEGRRSSNHTRADIKAARINYELLAPAMAKRNFETDKIIKNNFTNAYRSLSTGSLYSNEKARPDSDQFALLVTKIITSLEDNFIAHR